MNNQPTAKTRPPLMTITEAAAARVKHIMERQEKDAIALRIGVKNGGCAGMEYTMDWAKEAGRFDEQVETSGVKVLIDAKAVMFLLGTVMDYEQTVLKSGFVFRNPNQIGSCGCGESVNLKPVAAVT